MSCIVLGLTLAKRLHNGFVWDGLERNGQGVGLDDL